MRIRSIKPEFWRSEDITSLPLSTRLTFIGLWSYVDDNGVGDFRVSSIAADLFADDLARDPQETLRRVSGDTQTLKNTGLITVYAAGRKQLFYVTNWEAHQIVNRPSKGHQYPLPPADLVESQRNCMRHSGDTQEGLNAGAGEQGSRGTGEQGIKDMSETSSDVPTPKPTAYPEAFETWWAAYPRHKNASKKKSLDSWRKAVKIISAEQLLELTQIYAANPGVDEIRLIPHPTTWLNEHRWESIEEHDQAPRPQTQPGRGYLPSDWLFNEPPIVDAEIEPPHRKELAPWETAN